MSADNFIAIIKKGRGCIGYYCCASHSYPYVKCFECLGRKHFATTSLRHAIDLAQAKNTEYGVSLHDWKEELDTDCPCETKRFIDEL